MRYRYRHRFLIPAVTLSIIGVASGAVRTAMTGFIAADDIVIAVVSVLGAVIVCAGRRRAYGWISFRRFTVEDWASYSIVLMLLLCCLAVGFIRHVPLSFRILDGVVYLLLSVRLRQLLADVKSRTG